MTSAVLRQKVYRQVSPFDGSKPTRSPAPGGWAGRRAGVPGLPAVSATRRCRQSKRLAEIAENAGIDGNEVLEGSRVTGKSLAETAETPCKYFAVHPMGETVKLRAAVSVHCLDATPRTGPPRDRPTPCAGACLSSLARQGPAACSFASRIRRNYSAASGVGAIQ
jgi:hypothetical protein